MSSSSSVYLVDCDYIRPQFAAAYILHNGSYAAIIETGTKYSVPAIVEQLERLKVTRENVLYILPTHVHLDHAAGAGYLAQEFPNAKILAHPRGRAHLINTQRLKEGSVSVYGKENFEMLFGDIRSIDAEKVVTAEHGMKLKLGDETLQLYHCAGHASHHFSVFLETKKVLFTGDSFGIGYPELQGANFSFVFPSTTPIDFNAKQAIESVDMFLKLKPSAVALTHFGIYSDVDKIGKELKDDLELFGQWVEDATQKNETEATEYIKGNLKEYFKKKFEEKNINPELLPLVDNDMQLNAMGLVVASNRLKKKMKK